jgi:hypothetical protein
MVSQAAYSLHTFFVTAPGSPTTSPQTLLRSRTSTGCVGTARVRLDGSRDQPESPDEQEHHHQRVEEAGALEIDVHVGNHTREDEQRSCHREKPSDYASPIPERQADAEQHRHQRQAEGAGSVEVPVGTHHAHLIRQEVAAQANHDESDDESAEATRRSAGVAEGSVFHGRRVSNH